MTRPMTPTASATFESDYLVIGGGIAGLIFAIKAAETGTVTVLTKAASNEANTAYAQGGIASVWSVDDSFESHVDDTLRAGAGLCNRHAVETIVRDGPEAVRELIAPRHALHPRRGRRRRRIRPRPRGRP